MPETRIRPPLANLGLAKKESSESRGLHRLPQKSVWGANTKGTGNGNRNRLAVH